MVFLAQGAVGGQPFSGQQPAVRDQIAALQARRLTARYLLIAETRLLNARRVLPFSLVL
jgi:hypothetical protein